MTFRIEDLSPSALESLRKEDTLVVFTVGALEDHGPHLPFSAGLKVAAARAVSFVEKLEKADARWNVIMMPPMPLGIDTSTSRLRWPQRAHVLRDYLVDSAKEFDRLGIKKFVVFSSVNGPRQLTAIEEAGKTLVPIWRFWSKKTQFLSANSANVPGKEVIRSPFWFFPREHGGEAVTSVLLHTEPGVVDPMAAELPEIPRPKSHIELLWQREQHTLDGYWGRPGQSSAEKGKQWLDETSKADLERILKVLDGGSAGSTFRTWYSLIPTNKSHFNAAVLAILICAVILLSYMLSGLSS